MSENIIENNDVNDVQDSENLSEESLENSNLGQVQDQSQQKDNFENFETKLRNIDEENALNLIFNSSEEEFLTNFQEENISAEEILAGRKQVKEKLQNEIFSRDLKQIQEKYPYLNVNDIKKMPNFEKFAKLRSSNLSAIESFEGANSKFILENSKKRQVLNNSHLKQVSMKANQKAFMPIPKDELDIWKSAFPKDNFSELTKRYNITKRRKV